MKLSWAGYPSSGNPARSSSATRAGTRRRPRACGNWLPRRNRLPCWRFCQKLPAKRPVRAADLVARIREGLGKASLESWKRIELPRRRWISMAAGLGFVALSALLWRSSVVEALGRTRGSRFRSLPARPPDSRLVLVSIDDSTLEADNTPLAQKADEFGAEIDHAFANGAKAVAMDLLAATDLEQLRSAFSDSVLRHAPRLTLSALSSASGAVVGPECIAGLTTTALGPEQASSLFGAVNLVEDPDRVVRRGRLAYPDRDGGERVAWATRAVETLIPGRSESLREAVGDSYFRIDYSVRRDRFLASLGRTFPQRSNAIPRPLMGVWCSSAGGSSREAATTRTPYRTPERPKVRFQGSSSRP